jgi:uncharacterized protein YnzC (UPF0291/DUF896 family)
MKSPFVEGPVAAGRYFIGRKEYLAKCKEFVKYGSRGCFSVCGLPRIGKTSIVTNAVKTKSKHIVIVNINLSTMTSFFDLWNQIIIGIFSRLDALGVSFLFTGPGSPEHKGKITGLCGRQQLTENQAAAFAELREYLIDFFKNLAAEKFKTVIVIDEFDYINKSIFGNDDYKTLNLNLLREICTQLPDTRISLILVSRRDIANLDSKTVVGSTFHGVFGNNRICVTGFNDADYKLYLDILEKNNVKAEGRIKNGIEIYGGRSPYLLAQIGNYLVQEAREHGSGDDKADIKKFARSQSMINYYEDLIRILEDEGYYETMIKVFIGPKYDLKPADVYKLKNLGYIYYQDKENQRPYSLTKDFSHYLYEKVTGEEKIQIWPKLSEAEIRLREIIRNALTDRFKNNWEQEIRNVQKSEGNKFINIEKADTFMKSNSKNYPGEQNLLKVLAIWELSSIIQHFWNDGIGSRFPNNTARDDWAAKFRLLQRARDPLAHSNPEFLTSEEIKQANIYCDEIINNTTP